MPVENSISSSPNLTLLTQGVDRLSNQETALQSALSSGVTSDSYAGLGDQRYQALDLQPQITKVATWQTNITAAQATLDVTQTAMSQITTIATKLQASLVSLQGDKSATSVDAAATEARQSLVQLANLLNTQNGSQYVFAGTDSADPPVADPADIASGSFFKAISASVASVGDNQGATAVEAATVATASDDTSGMSVFSTGLSSGTTSLNRTITVGQGYHIPIGVVATGGGTASATSTGSPIRDLMRALAVVGSLDQADASTSSFATLVSDTGVQMGVVNSGLGQAVTTMGQTQAQLTIQSSTLSRIGDTLTKQLNSIKSSDPATISTQLTDTQNQLQASYSLIADMKGMSLAAYL